MESFSCRANNNLVCLNIYSINFFFRLQFIYSEHTTYNQTHHKELFYIKQHGKKPYPKSRCIIKYDKHLQYNKLIILRRKKKSYLQTAGNGGFGFSFRILRLSARKGTHIIKKRKKFVYTFLLLASSRTFLINQKYEVSTKGCMLNQEQICTRNKTVIHINVR